MEKKVEGFTVRQADEGDEVVLAEIDRLCFPDPWTEAMYAQELEENPFALYILAETEERVIGYIGLWIVAQEGHITNVAVHPDYRKNGVGISLIKLMMNFCEKQDIYEFTLEARISNSVAIRLYERCGFRKEGLRKKYYQNNGEDALIMWRRDPRKAEIAEDEIAE